MKVINQIKLNIDHSFSDLLNKVAKILHIKVDDIDESKFRILRKSIDARDKNNVMYVYNVAVDYEDENKLNFHPHSRTGRDQRSFVADALAPIGDKEATGIPVQSRDPRSFVADAQAPIGDNIRPIVVGFGPAGIFASYIFALNNLKPIIIERGKSIEERTKDVDRFFKTLELDENSNVCFGEGGAGAFSDGKLNTNNKDKAGIYQFVLSTFVKFGADPSILYDSLPHIGTDKLTDIIKNIRDEILRLGGEIRYSTKFTYDEYNRYAKGGTPIVLAIGNSSRDTFRDLIKNGFDIRAKAFAIGFRVAHKQKLINKAQFGNFAEKLPPATYKLTYDVGNGHSVYSFCMCPGGYIINSSNFKGYLSINGMSYNDRSGKYANSAIVETITPEDLARTGFYPRSFVADALAPMGDISAEDMIAFQETVEKKAHELASGFIPYKKVDFDNINEEEIFKGKACENDDVLNIYEDLGLKFSIKEDIKKALMHFSKIIPSFDKNVIAGVETRTSSPVKLDRDENYMSNVKNFYPCGEGLGHGGGILSCAADGVQVAMKIVDNL